MGRESSLSIRDMKPQKQVPGNKFSKQSQISIRAEASLQQLVDFLYALYNSPLLFSVEKLVLTPKGEGATTLSVTMVVARLTGRSDEARRSVAKTDIESNLALAIDLYEVDTGEYPSSLDALLSASSDTTNWKGPYLKKRPLDPWGR